MAGHITVLNKIEILLVRKKGDIARATNNVYCKYVWLKPIPEAVRYTIKHHRSTEGCK